MKKFIYLVLSVVVASLFSITASAALPEGQATFKFEPVNFKGGIPFVYDLTPGSKMTNAMRVQNFSDAEVSLKLSVALPPDETGDLSWFSLSASEVTIDPQSYEDVEFSVVVPADSEIGTTYKAVVTATSFPEKTEGVEGEAGATIGVATGYATTFKVNVGSGEAAVVDETPATGTADVWAFIKENINTILLVLIFLLVAKMACCRGKGKKK